MTNINLEDGLTGNDRIIKEAQRRFKSSQDWESVFRPRYVNDLRFANADSYNQYQWPGTIRQSRELNDRPCLTINKVRQHNLQIINDAKQNTPSIKVNAVGDGATYDSAQIFEGIIRHIEYISNAPTIYDNATVFQVQGGIGYWRLSTDYVGDDSFDQEIYIRNVRDPLNVYMDPDINEKDGSDAQFCFIFDDIPLEEAKKLYPKFKDKFSQTALGDNVNNDWLTKNHVRVAEYYHRTQKKDRLLAFTDPVNGQQHIIRDSKISAELRKAAAHIIDDPSTEFRTITDDIVEHYLIIGNEVAEKTEWLGKYIPIVRVIGEETVIDGIMDRKGHTRAMIDPQRMYNYASSASVEFVALQTKTPFIAPAQAIEGLETYYTNANTENYAYLPYNHVDDDGNPIPAPERAVPPTQSTAYLQAMQTAQQEMMMTSGQYEASFGQKSNERSGVAINERQRQGDNATYHFIDNLAVAIRFTGKILIDLIPKVYDTPRIIRILAEDGTDSHVQLDPKAQQAYAEKKQAQKEEIAVIFNPNVGRYDVQADVGPGYATKRQEAFNAFTEIVQHNPELTNIVGDLLFKNADFPGAEEIAERLERMVPPMAKGEGPSPEAQAMQEQLQNLQSIIGKMTEQLVEAKLKNKDTTAKNDTDQYRALTDRLDLMMKTIMTPRDIATFQRDLVMQEHASNRAMMEAQHAQDIAPEPVAGI